MPRHLAMWMAAGGSALVSAAITYAVTRPRCAPASSGNRDRASKSVRDTAFEEYRASRLRELDEDERDFRDFLEKLRGALDRAEFDQFMQTRKGDPRSRRGDARPT